MLGEHFPLERLKGKIVFIGAKQSAGYSGTGKDTFRSPYSRLGNGDWNGVDFHIVALENYLNGKHLNALSLLAELAVLALSCLILTSVMLPSSDRPRYIYLVCLGILIPSCGIYVSENHLFTFPWLSILCIQLPLLSLFVVLDRPIKKEIFISYSHKDAKEEDFVTPLVNALEKAGLRCWLDKHDVKIGDDYRDAISQGMAQSRGFILFKSARTSVSQEVLSEIRLARANKLKQFSVQLGNKPDKNTKKAQRTEEEQERRDKTKETINKEFVGTLALDCRKKTVAEIDFNACANTIRRKLKISLIRVLINKILPTDRRPPLYIDNLPQTKESE